MPEEWPENGERKHHKAKKNYCAGEGAGAGAGAGAGEG